jgi:1,4-alpha-glucan branching enzyme
MRERSSLLFFNLLMVSIICCSCGSGLPPWEEQDYDVGPKFLEEGVRFAIYAPDAKSVNLAGSFNNWSKTSDPLKDEDGNGVWEIVIPVPQGRTEYKFVIDGERWIPDPANTNTVDDGFGGKNSVIHQQ